MNKERLLIDDMHETLETTLSAYKLFFKDYNKLKEENEKLKYMLAMSNKELELYTEYVEKENENLKQRIDKAIEYLNNKIPYWREWHYDDIDIDGDIQDLLDILKRRK